MKRIGPCALAAALALFSCSLARAEMDWAGPYLGADVGLVHGLASTSFLGDADEDGTFGSGTGNAAELSDGGFNHSLRRWIYGVHTGFHVRVWRPVFAGIEASYDQLNGITTTRDNIPAIGNPGDHRVYQTRVNWLLSLAPQVGYAWRRALFHAKGGFAAGRVYSAMRSEGQAVAFDQAQAHLGWVFGVGSDLAVTDHVFAGFGFDYYDLGTIDFGGKSRPDGAFPLAYQVHPILRTFTARVGYKF